MQDNFEFHLGKVDSINTDGSINIQDFKTGSQIYQNIAIEHTAADTQQAVEGQHVLFVTVNQGPATQTFTKIVRLYGSQDADQKFVLSSPLDLAPGEKRIVSQSGASVYVANGAIFIGSLGQSIFIEDKTASTKIVAGSLKIFTQAGFEISQNGNSLVIQKGIFDPSAPDVQLPTTTITVTGDKVQIQATTVEINGNSVGVARLNDTTQSDTSTDSSFWTFFNQFIQAFQTWVPVPSDGGAALKTLLSTVFNTTQVPTKVQSKVTSASATVKTS